MKIRAVSVPLITVDPFFSVWSPADKLTDNYTCHWTSRINSMLGMVKVDGKLFRFMGSMMPQGNAVYKTHPEALPQTDLDITPTASIYTFENDLLKLTVTFRTPLLMNDLVLMSRPVSYIEYNAELKGEYDFELYFDAGTEFACDWEADKIKFTKTERSLSVGKSVQTPLNASGDDCRIGWGYFHLADKDAFVSDKLCRYNYIMNRELPKFEDFSRDDYTQCAHRTLAVIKKETKGLIVLAYDDIKSIQYFGENLDPYYKTKYATFE